MVQPFLPSRLPVGSVDEDMKKSGQYLGDPNRPWWFKIAREVRECDERKVRDYKEDIDTLLVFGALFSVVITTLVIESYRSLRQDPADLTVQILLQVSQQLSSYHVNGQFSNSTIPSFSLPSFTPSKSMIIVNIMWFGSLMISLMAASYGMLVKQWLGEYLANRDISPLARLRIRCFRYPALAKWKVFEIVGILPLLLQLALGLFFVGLCYFASSIHPAIQWTVIPLVVIWASLFILAAFAPVVSASCPYKMTFLKDVMAQLRRAKLVMFNKVMHTSANTLSVVEEDDIAKNDTIDFDVLVQVDVTQADDGLISLALVDLGHQHQGPNLISFIFTIFNHRDSTITLANIDYLPNILYLSLPLLQAAYTAITKALRVEYRKTIASHGSQGQLVNWDDWVQDSLPLLLLMSRSISQSTETLGICLEIAHPDVLDGLMNPVMASVGWSEEQKMMFVKAVIQLINPSSMDSDDLRPLRLRNLSAQSWKCAMALFESSIFTGGTGTSSIVWNQEVRFGFRGVFGESQHVAPRYLCERIRTSFRSDELIERLLSNISSSAVCGHGRDVISYTLQIIRIHHEIPITLDLSFLPERSWFIVSRLFMDGLKDECTKRTEDMEEGFKRDSLVLDAICASLSTVQHPPSTDCLEVIASFYQLDPEMLSNSLMAHFSRSTSPPWTIAIPTILRLLENSDVEQGDPWSIALNLSTHTFHQLDLLANIAAKSLAALQASIRDNDPDTLKWVKWAIHILLSCVDVSDSFSGSTLSAIAKLTESNTHFIVRALPQNWQDRQHQVERLWKTIRVMRDNREAFIMQLWPRAWSPSDSITPYQLTQMYATERKWTTTDAFLHTPPGFRAHHDVGNFIVCHLDHSRTLDYARRKGCVDELQSCLKSNIAWHAVHQIAAFLIQIGDPGWPEWMKGFIIKKLTSLQRTSELSDNLKKCLYYNATEYITLLASHDIEHLDRLPQNLLVHRNLVDHPLTSMFHTFLQHPEPLSSETGESCLMRLLVNAEIDKPTWTFSSCDSYSPPRYACVSLALRILRYHLGSKGIQIPQKDIRFPLDLSQLKKEVWGDVSTAAAQVLARDEFHDIDEDYFGGQKTFNIARMDAIMILLADSPHSFYNDLSYQVLEQESFFRWEDNLSVQSGTRHKLEKRRQSRIDERRGQGHHGSSVGAGDYDEASSLWQVIVTKSSQQIEEVYSQVKNDGDVQEDETMCGSNCIHRDGLGG